MRRALLALPLAAILAIIIPCSAVALGDTKVDAGQCSIATSGSATNNSVTCNFGLTPEQLKQVTEAAVKGATGPLLDRVVDISKTLGVTEEAAKTLLKIAGEEPNVPNERLAEVLTKVANDYKRLQAQAAALKLENPTARGLIVQANAEIEAGHLARAREFLHQARLAQIAAAQEALKLRDQAQAANAKAQTSAYAHGALTRRAGCDGP